MSDCLRLPSGLVIAAHEMVTMLTPILQIQKQRHTVVKPLSQAAQQAGGGARIGNWVARVEATSQYVCGRGSLPKVSLNQPKKKSLHAHGHCLL